MTLRHRVDVALRPYEGRLLSSMPLRYRLLAVARRPSILGHWFRQVTVLPGDEFYDLTRDCYVRVVEVKPRRVRVRLLTGQARAAGIRFDSPLLQGASWSYATRARPPGGFWL